MGGFSLEHARGGNGGQLSWNNNRWGKTEKSLRRYLTFPSISKRMRRNPHAYFHLLFFLFRACLFSPGEERGDEGSGFPSPHTHAHVEWAYFPSREQHSGTHARTHARRCCYFFFLRCNFRVGIAHEKTSGQLMRFFRPNQLRG